MAKRYTKLGCNFVAVGSDLEHPRPHLRTARRKVEDERLGGHRPLSDTPLYIKVHGDGNVAIIVNNLGGQVMVVGPSSIAKLGSSPIVGVLSPGQRADRKGLIYAATPASDFVCGTLQLASGCNMEVFTAGRGTPYGLAMVPVIKVSTRTALAERWHDLIDVDAGRIATGQATIEDIGWEIFRMILDVASGRRKTRADHREIRNAMTLFNPAPVT
ncbi:UxaA family hydrolase [Azospirillum sp. INR13]|uniref:UxaA family hydrolase n=1 Tax=Azospirillum sp. INR13 TaxID=2596919 RepID=UPI0021031B40|nr:UxaA family hydrolase [Azospirillum sp. INR13]